MDGVLINIYGPPVKEKHICWHVIHPDGDYTRLRLIEIVEREYKREDTDMCTIDRLEAVIRDEAKIHEEKAAAWDLLKLSEMSIEYQTRIN